MADIRNTGKDDMVHNDVDGGDCNNDKNGSITMDVDTSPSSSLNEQTKQIQQIQQRNVMLCSDSPAAGTVAKATTATNVTTRSCDRFFSCTATSDNNVTANDNDTKVTTVTSTTTTNTIIQCDDNVSTKNKSTNERNCMNIETDRSNENNTTTEIETEAATTPIDDDVVADQKPITLLLDDVLAISPELENVNNSNNSNDPHAEIQLLQNECPTTATTTSKHVTEMEQAQNHESNNVPTDIDDVSADNVTIVSETAKKVETIETTQNVLVVTSTVTAPDTGSTSLDTTATTTKITEKEEKKKGNDVGTGGTSNAVIDENGCIEFVVDEATIKSLRIVCPLCNGLFREPITLCVCQHTFCKSCYITAFERCNFYDCPVCFTYIGQDNINKVGVFAYDRTLEHLIDTVLFPEIAIADRLCEIDFYINQHKILPKPEYAKTVLQWLSTSSLPKTKTSTNTIFNMDKKISLTKEQRKQLKRMVRLHDRNTRSRVEYYDDSDNDANIIHSDRDSSGSSSNDDDTDTDFDTDSSTSSSSRTSGSSTRSGEDNTSSNDDATGSGSSTSCSGNDDDSSESNSDNDHMDDSSNSTILQAGSGSRKRKRHTSNKRKSADFVAYSMASSSSSSSSSSSDREAFDRNNNTTKNNNGYNNTRRIGGGTRNDNSGTSSSNSSNNNDLKNEINHEIACRLVPHRVEHNNSNGYENSNSNNSSGQQIELPPLDMEYIKTHGQVRIGQLKHYLYEQIKSKVAANSSQISILSSMTSASSSTTNKINNNNNRKVQVKKTQQLKESQLEIYCNSIPLGNEWSLAFVVRTVWMDPNNLLTLSYGLSTTNK